MMGIMLNQSAYVSQVVEGQVISFSKKWYTVPYRKYCFITLKMQKDWGFFHLDLRNIVRVKPGIKLLRLNYKSKYASRNRLSEVIFLMKDELPLASSDFLINIDLRLTDIFIMISEK